MPAQDREHPEKSLTVRQQLQQVLAHGPLSCRELSQQLRRSEKEILDHLAHLRLSLQHQGRKLEIIAAACHRCGYTFDHRQRLGKPGKCPACRHTGIEPPLFCIVVTGDPVRDRA